MVGSSHRTGASDSQLGRERGSVVVRLSTKKAIAIACLGLGCGRVVEEPRRTDGGCAPDVQELSSTCALNTRGDVWCWGPNLANAFGDGSTKSQSAPVKVP